MKTRIIYLLVLLLGLPTLRLAAQSTPAFPGAEGHGRYTVGGRSGTVYHVTTLEDSDAKGTLRYAVKQKGARTIVFDVAGTIHLKSDLKIVNDYLTIAGQTAPGQGICIADYPVVLSANDIILRYLRFRVGTESIASGGEPDGLGGMDKKNIIIDHCSVSWSVDECLSVYGSENITVQWCIASESLRSSGHSKGKHGYGGNWGGAHASYHHNLMAHHESRVPRLGPRPGTQEREYMDLRNNVFYNWAGNGCYGGEGMQVNIVNNYYKPGPATPQSAVRYRIAKIGIRTTAYCTNSNGTPNEWKPMEHVWGKFYVDGNFIEGNAEVTADNWTKGIYEQINNSECDNTFNDRIKAEMKLAAPLETNVITTHTPRQALKQVLLYAGCSKQRDIIDERIVKETETGTAAYKGSISSDASKKPGLIDLPTDVKPAGASSPWPELSNGGITPDQLKDTDSDGMPDTWETTNGLNPNDASDGKATTLSKNGYSNLEVYLNSLVADITEKQNTTEDGEGGGDIPGTEVNVTPATLKSAFDAAADGTVLLLASGDYTETIGVPTARAITLKAARDAKPILKFNGEITGKTEKNGSLLFDGVTIDPANVNYFINLTNGAYLKSLQFRNCRINSSKRGLMSIANKGVNGELVIDNCIVNPDKATGYSYIYNNGGATQKVTITRSTFYNYPQEHLFWIRSYGEALDFHFTFEQNTVYKWSKDSNYRICKIEEKNFTDASTYTFRNNIVAEPFVAGKTPAMLDTQGAGTLIAENNLFVNYGGYTGSSLTENRIKDLVLDEGALEGMTAIGFSNPESGDFTLYANSPLATASTTGGIIGDPRWLKAAGTLYTLTTGLADGVEEGAGNVSIASGTQYADGSSVTIKATRNFGYKFIGWTDDKGQPLSADAEYTFTMDADRTVKAKFEAIDVFALTLNITGAGKYGNITISPAGKDGEYKLYETGTPLILTAADNRVIKFSNWEDGSTNKERTLVMDGDKELTATFAPDEYIAGWDFANASLKAPFNADYLSDPELFATLSIYAEDGSSTGGKIGNRNGKNGVQMNQAKTMGRGGYYQAEFSTVGFKNIKVASSMLAYYFSYLTQKIQYAIGNGEFKDIQSFDINANSWTDMEITLPADAAGVESMKLRWYPDMEKASADYPDSGNELMLADVFITAEEDKGDVSVLPKLISSVPVDNATGASATGQIVLSFNKRVQTGQGNATLNGKTLIPTVINKTVAYAYNGLDYETQYEFILPAGAITDVSDNAFEGIRIRFTTMSRPQVTKKVYDFIVATDGTGDGTTIQSAFDAAARNANRTERFRIFVKDGIYDAAANITTLTTNNVSLIGQSRDGVIIRSNNGTGISTSSTIHIERNVSGFYAQDITIQNAYDYESKAAVAVALYDRSDKSIYKNVRLLSYQDTQVTGVDVRQYYEDCEIQGTVDFICGGGDIYFNRALLYLKNRAGNVIAAPSTSANCKYGYVFDRCTIDGAAVNDQSYALGRPWQSAPRAVYLHTKMNVIPKVEGWSEMMKEGTPALFAEYNSMTADGYAVNLKSRKKVFNNTPVGYNPELSAEEAATYTVASVLGGKDAWQPMLATEQVIAPVLNQTNGILSWNEIPYALNYIVVRDGKVVAVTTKTSFSETLEKGTYEYKVHASNEFGGTGLSSNPVSVNAAGTGIGKDSADNVEVYASGNTVYTKGLSGNSRIEVYTYNGILIQHLRIADTETSFSLSAGSYIVRVVTRDKMNVKKILIP